MTKIISSEFNGYFDSQRNYIFEFEPGLPYRIIHVWDDDWYTYEYIIMHNNHQHSKVTG